MHLDRSRRVWRRSSPDVHGRPRGVPEPADQAPESLSASASPLSPVMGWERPVEGNPGTHTAVGFRRQHEGPRAVSLPVLGGVPLILQLCGSTRAWGPASLLPSWSSSRDPQPRSAPPRERVGDGRRREPHCGGRSAGRRQRPRLRVAAPRWQAPLPLFLVGKVLWPRRTTHTGSGGVQGKTLKWGDH